MVLCWTCSRAKGSDFSVFVCLGAIFWRRGAHYFGAHSLVALFSARASWPSGRPFYIHAPVKRLEYSMNQSAMNQSNTLPAMVGFDLNAPLEEEPDVLDLNVRLEEEEDVPLRKDDSDTAGDLRSTQSPRSLSTTAFARGNASLAWRPEQASSFADATAATWCHPCVTHPSRQGGAVWSHSWATNAPRRGGAARQARRRADEQAGKVGVRAVARDTKRGSTEAGTH
jgi:hypothetical protein